MTTADQIRAWTAANERARRAYHRPRTEAQTDRARAKAARKAEAQRLYRLRKKEEGQ